MLMRDKKQVFEIIHNLVCNRVVLFGYSVFCNLANLKITVFTSNYLKGNIDISSCSLNLSFAFAFICQIALATIVL